MLSIDRIKQYYLWICLVILILAISLTYFGTSIGLVSKQIEIIQNSKIVTENVLVFPFYANLMQLLGTFLYALCISIFIAIFIISKIELKLKEEKQRELNELSKSINIDVFEALFKKLIPYELFEVIKSEIINNKLIRKNMQWFFDFTVSSDSNNIIKVKKTIKYELHNISNEDIPDHLCIKHDDFLTKEKIIRAIYIVDGHEEISYDKDDTSTHSQIKIKESGLDDKIKTIRFDYTIPKEKQVDVTLVFDSNYKGNNFQDSFFTAHPVIDGLLIATYPKNYKFNLYDALSSDMVCILKEEGREIYEVKGGILPHQGFSYGLEEKEE